MSTLADQVGACAAALKPVHALIEAHVLAAERLHGDDTTVPILARGRTDTGRIWTYVRDDRPFGGTSPPAALYYASRDRRQEHPARHLTTFGGILQADAYGGYNPLFKVDRDPSPLTQALCWAHARRKFFVLADIATNAKRGKDAAPISPIAFEAVKRIDALFDIEREINGISAGERMERRRQESRLLVDALYEWMRTERAKLSRSSPVAEPIDYMLKRWDGFTAFLGNGRICLTNNAAERALRGFAITRSLCPCRGRTGSSLSLASIFWPKGQRAACGAAGNWAVSQGAIPIGHCRIDSRLDGGFSRLRGHDIWPATG